MKNAGFKTASLCFSILLANCFNPMAFAKSEPTQKNRRDTTIQLGLFDLAPSLSVTEEFNDNIFLSDSYQKSDTISRVLPALTLQSNWQRVRLRLEALGDAGFYTKSDEDDYLDGELGVSAGSDIGPAFAVDGDFRIAKGHEDRGGEDIPTGAREPVTYDEKNTEIALRYFAGDVHYRAAMAFRQLDFDDTALTNGDIANNDDRDRLELRLIMRASYQLGLGREAYGETTLNQREYESTPDDQGIFRNSNGYRLLGGMTFDLTDLIKADIGTGWMSQIYEDYRLQNNEGFSLRAAATWNITRMTVLDFRAKREIGETTVTGASGIIGESFDAGIEHELRRWLSIRLNAGYQQDRFEGAGRTDKVTRFGGGVLYELNRFTELDASWRYDQRKSNETGHDYRRNRALLTLRLKM